jgi:para-aminobenzoate synthetase component 1
MRVVDPLVLGRPEELSDIAPGVPSGCRQGVREHARLEWRVADGGDPAAVLAGFLADLGRPVDDLSRPSGTRDADLCGVAVLISADAAAVMAGAPPGPASPAPGVPDLVAVGYRHAASPLAPAPAGRTGAWRLGPWCDSWTPAGHAEAVSRVRDAIAAGEVYQVNLVGHASARYSGDPLPALRRVAALPGAAYPGVLAGAGWAVACASPETLVEVTGGRAVTRPVKGTRPATAAGRAELFGSAKERAEHVMIVDLSRNDLGRLAATGSVRVDRLYAVRRWCDLWQAESTVSGTLAAGVGLADVLRALCPGGSVTGAPKRAALEAIARLEPVGRGPSMGALGWIGPDRLDLGLTIRTVAVECAGADSDRVHLWAGGGITWGSDPAAEVAEAAAKAAPIRAALAG